MSKYILSLLIILFNFSSLSGQTLDEINSIIKNLNIETDSLTERIMNLNELAEGYNYKKVEQKYNEKENYQLVTNAKSGASIKNGTSYNSKITGYIPSGKKIILIDFNVYEKVWRASYKGQTGYVWDPTLTQTQEMEYNKSHAEIVFKELKILERQLALKNKELKKRLSDKEHAEEAVKNGNRYVKRQEEKRKRLNSRYGKEIADKIINKAVWIGMTSVMTRESLGDPEKITKKKQKMEFQNNGYIQ